MPPQKGRLPPREGRNVRDILNDADLLPVSYCSLRLLFCFIITPLTFTPSRQQYTHFRTDSPARDADHGRRRARRRQVPGSFFDKRSTYGIHPGGEWGRPPDRPFHARNTLRRTGARTLVDSGRIIMNHNQTVAPSGRIISNHSQTLFDTGRIVTNHNQTVVRG